MRRRLGWTELLCVLLLVAAPAPSQTWTFTRLAGPLGNGSADGRGDAARFNGPTGLAADLQGNLYVTDSSTHTVRKVSPAGEVTTLAGLAGVFDEVDGKGSAARFSFPQGVALDTKSGVLWVADSYGNTIRKVTLDGVVTTVAGLANTAGSSDGIGSSARFNLPQGLAVDAQGNAFVVDSINQTIRKVTPEGVVTTVAGEPGVEGFEDGAGSQAHFAFDWDGAIAIDPDGNLFVADSGACTIRRVTPQGVVTTLAGSPAEEGAVDGVGSAARFAFPAGIAIDTHGVLYATEGDGHSVRKVTPSGVVTTLAGLAFTAGADDGVGTSARFNRPDAIAVDGAGNVYVGDGGSGLRKILPDGRVTTLAGLPGGPGAADGTGNSARFYHPRDVAIDAAGNAYVADFDNQTVRKVTPAGVVTTVAGAPGQKGSADGTASKARFNGPIALTLDAAGVLYVSDYRNHTVRRISAGVVSTLGGLATQAGSGDGTGSAARFRNPVGLSTDAAGNLWVADAGNHTVRKITPGGVVSTVAGLAGSPGSADGTGSAARFSQPYGIAAERGGDVFVSDLGNQTLRRLAPSGVVTTLAGLAGTPGADDGPGVAARFNAPAGLGLDQAGNLFVADRGNNTLRRVTPSGSVTTIGGQPGRRGAYDGTGAEARFDGPNSVRADGAGNLYVADTTTNVVRIGRPALADAATIDAASGFPGVPRLLGSSPSTATGWKWQVVRRPSGSTAALNSETARSPAFTPDVPDLFVFRLTASSVEASSITTVSLLGAAGCATQGPVLCLNGNRFTVQVAWKNPYDGGSTGVGTAVALSSDTGYFWFFSAANAELVVKILDGRSTNGHFWVFYGALSDVEYTVTVTDMATGVVKTYHNPPRNLGSVADTQAFAVPGSPEPRATRIAVSPEFVSGERALQPRSLSGCTTSGPVLCLNGGRFLLTVSWKNPYQTGSTGIGTATQLTSDTGTFWFFDAANVELMVKVLDGCGVNGHFWVFYGALSDVEYTLSVTDTVTGSAKTYYNPPRNLGSLADVNALTP